VAFSNPSEKYAQGQIGEKLPKFRGENSKKSLKPPSTFGPQNHEK